MIISIADLPIEWQENKKDFVKAFITDFDEKPVMSISFKNKLPECHGIQYTESDCSHTLRVESGEILCADADWSRVSSYYTLPSHEYTLTLAAICSKFSYFDTVLMHASCIDCDGNGIIFTGYSGVGKTTHATLWNNYANADIINGDKILIREINNTLYACGLPWKGSSEYCLNKKTKLKSIIVLRQAKENKLTPLNSSSATELTIPHFFLPYWDEKCTDNACKTIDKILRNIPVFLLECRPDEDAVNLVKNTIF